MKSRFIHFYKQVRRNYWHALFYLFCRCLLAWGFIAAGLIKIIGERFASGLSIKHPMGAYLEALHHTGFYYPFIGVAQLAAGILLIIPRTVLLGALLYFPIIFNIWVLSWAVRFEGSLFTSTLMVLANLYILLYNYDRLQFIFPVKSSQLRYKAPVSLNSAERDPIQAQENGIQFNPGWKAFKSPLISKKFPWGFLGIVIASAVITLFASNRLFELMPRNSYGDCISRLKNHTPKQAGFDFCNCIHNQGKSLDACLKDYDALKKNNQK